MRLGVRGRFDLGGPGRIEAPLQDERERPDQSGEQQQNRDQQAVLKNRNQCVLRLQYGPNQAPDPEHQRKMKAAA